MLAKRDYFCKLLALSKKKSNWKGISEFDWFLWNQNRVVFKCKPSWVAFKLHSTSKVNIPFLILFFLPKNIYNFYDTIRELKKQTILKTNCIIIFASIINEKLPNWKIKAVCNYFYETIKRILCKYNSRYISTIFLKSN